jgi:hypothetical protein
VLKACFAADISFKEMHVDAWAGNVMAARGAGGAAGPAPRHCDQPPGKAIYIYCDFCLTYKHAGREVVKAAGCYAQECGFKAGPLQYFFFLYILLMAKYVHGIYMV